MLKSHKHKMESLERSRDNELRRVDTEPYERVRYQDDRYDDRRLAYHENRYDNRQLSYYNDRYDGQRPYHEESYDDRRPAYHEERYHNDEGRHGKKAKKANYGEGEG